MSVSDYARHKGLQPPKESDAAGALVRYDTSRSTQLPAIDTGEVKMGQIVIGFAQPQRGVGVTCWGPSQYKLQCNDLFLAGVFHKTLMAGSKGSLDIFVWRDPKAYSNWRADVVSGRQVNGMYLTLQPQPPRLFEFTELSCCSVQQPGLCLASNIRRGECGGVCLPHSGGLSVSSAVEQRFVLGLGDWLQPSVMQGMPREDLCTFLTEAVNTFLSEWARGPSGASEWLASALRLVLLMSIDCDHCLLRLNV